MKSALGFDLPRLLSITVLTLLIPGSLQAQTLREDLWVTDGSVSAGVVSGNTLYVGGSFSRVGPPSGSAVAYDPATAASVQPYLEVAGSVHAVASDGSGGWFLGGIFSSVLGQPRNNLAHVDAAGTLTAWDPSPNGRVADLVVSGSTLYVGGDFNTIAGKVRGYLASFDIPSEAITTWNPSATGGLFSVRGYRGVHCLAVSGGVVYAGGTFDFVGDLARESVAAVDASTGVPTSWNPGGGGEVRAIAVSGNTVYVGGLFTWTIGGQTRQSLAAIDASTGSFTTFHANAAGAVVNVVLPVGSTLFVGGNFSQMGGAQRFSLAALHAEFGSALLMWVTQTNGVVSDLTHDASTQTLYVGGMFSQVLEPSPVPRSNLASVDAVTGVLRAWSPEPAGEVLSVGFDAGRVMAGGLISTTDGLVRDNLAAFDLSTGQPTGWNPGANGAVSALAISADMIVAGGDFTSIGGQSRSGIAMLSASTGTVSGWSPNPNGSVGAIAMGAGAVFAGGIFTSVGGQARTNLAAIDSATGLATGFNAGLTFNDRVNALAVKVDPSVTLYVGGSYNAIGGQLRRGIAELNGTTGLATTWNPGSNGTVHALVIGSGLMYAGGLFTTIGGQPRSNLARLDLLSGSAAGWMANANQYVTALTLDGGTLYVGGAFSGIGGHYLPGGAAVAVGSADVQAWNPKIAGDFTAIPTSYVRAMVPHAGTVYAMGNFRSALGKPHPALAGISQGITTAVEPVAESTPARRIQASPNPFRGRVLVTFMPEDAAAADVTVHDVAGRLVRRLPKSASGLGTRSVAWDGRNDAGRPMGEGVYFIRVRTGAQALDSKVLLLR